MCDWFGFIADTHKILISLDFPFSQLVEKGNSENNIVLFSEELKVFSKYIFINPHKIPVKLTSAEIILFYNRDQNLAYIHYLSRIL